MDKYMRHKRWPGVLMVGLILLGTACRPGSVRNWEATSHVVDSLAAAGDTTGAFNVLRQFVRWSSQDERSAAVVDTIGRMLARFQQDAFAAELYEKAIQRHTGSGSSDCLDLARLLNGYGLALTGLARFETAHTVLDSALALRTELCGDASAEVAETHNALGWLAYSEANWKDALRAYQAALNIRRRLLATDDPALAASLNNIGNVYAILMERDSAKTAYLQAVAILDRHRPAQNYELASTLNNLAAVYADMERWDEALRRYQAALQLFEKTTGREHRMVAVVRDGMATVLFDLRRWDEAETQFREALALYGRLDRQSTEFANCEGNFAYLLFEMQKFDSAEVHARRGLALKQATFGMAHPETAVAHRVLAMVLAARGQGPEARGEQWRAHDIARNAFLTNYHALTEETALHFSSEYHIETAQLLTLLLGSRDMAVDTCRELTDAVLLSKGLVQEGMLARQKLQRGSRDPDVLARLQRLQSLRIRLAHLVPRRGAHQQEAAALRSQAAELEMELAARSPLQRQASAAELDTIYRSLRQLPDSVVLVDYLLFNAQYADETSELRLLAAVLDRDGLVANVDLGPAAPVKKAIDRYRDHITAPRTSSHREVKSASLAVYRSVWQPLLPYVEGAGTVIICPDGDLNLVSFAGLPDEAGIYIIEKQSVQYMSTARDLLRLHAASSAPQGRGILLLGGADYAKRLPPLPHAEAELKNVAAAWHSVYAEPVELVVGRQASEDAFYRHAHGKRVLYFAAHSLDITFASTGGGGGNGDIAYPGILPSGIVLAREDNARESPDVEADGILMAEEIAAQELEGTRLAVLSMCESGGGRLIRGEGVYGLRRAFQVAGVPTVISTLWPVDDQATAELMKYGLFDSTATYPEVMRRACLSRIRELRATEGHANPYLWAAFICTGDWKP